MEIENLDILQEVASALSAVGIPYALGGSLASSLLGTPRFTLDADISVDPFLGKETALLAQFGPEYYLSLTSIQEAIRQRTTFNIIHTTSGFKIDVFVNKDRPFESSVMRRRRAYQVGGQSNPEIMVTSPEDIILFKLEWYRLGNETSDRQWSDILGVLKVQAGNLDEAYLDQWAADLQVADLLARARQDSAS